MLNTILFILSLITPRSFVNFEVPVISLLSRSTIFFYPSVSTGYVPEFYIDPLYGEGYFLYNFEKGNKTIGSMFYASSYGLFSLFSIREGKKSIGIAINYFRDANRINAFVSSFSYRSSVSGFDVGFLTEKRTLYNYFTGYVRAFRRVGEQTDVVFGLRGIKEREKGIVGFINLIFSPVSGQYVTGTLGYSGWLRNFYVALGMNHQFYNNLAVYMGFYYPFKTIDEAPQLSRSFLEAPGILPSYPDFRFGFDIQDNSSIYTLSLSFNYQSIRDFINSGQFAPRLYEFHTGLSVYFYSF